MTNDEANPHVRSTAFRLPHFSHSSFVIRHWKRWRRKFLAGILVLVALWFILWGTWEGMVRWWPAPKGWERFPRGATVVMDREGTEMAAFVGEEDAWYVPLKREEISPWLRKAIVAVEDRRF